MASTFALTFLDRSSEKSTATFRGVSLTAGNFAAQAALMDALAAATVSITLGTKIKDERVAVVTTFAEVRPTNPFAQRENKWLLRFTDDVTPNGNGSMEIPAPDLGLLDDAGVYLDLASTEGAAFKAAFEDFEVSRLGNPVTLVSAQYVGRNN